MHTRRAFLTEAGAISAAAAVGVAKATQDSPTASVPEGVEAPEFPPLPPASLPPNCVINEFFTPAQARAVEAIGARIVPGTPDDPGAREACVVRYIDHKLAEFEAFAEPTFHEGPFPDLKDELGLSGDDAERYGFQSKLTPQSAYRNGLTALDELVQAGFGVPFEQLTDDQQDAVLEDLEKGDVAGFDSPAADDFFDMVRNDVIEGMFADPAYGGNFGLVGWTLIGYPGAQRGYTPVELRTGTTDRRPQALGDMSHTHPGRPSAGGERVMQLPQDGVSEG